MREMVESLTCDRCKKGYANTGYSSSFGVSVERYTDAAGSGETRSIVFELCPRCQTSVLQALLSEYDWDPAAVSFVKNLVPNAQVRD